MDLNEIKELITLMDDARLSEIEIEDSERRILLKRALAAPVALSPVVAPVTTEGASPSREEAEKKAADSKLHHITSPIVGTFYMAPSPTTNAYVELNDLVKKGQVICIVEAMKLMNEIESDVSGRIVEICVEDGAAVEYGEPLFTVEPA